MAGTLIVYSLKDDTSMEMAEIVKREAGFEESERIDGLRHFRYEGVSMLEIAGLHIEADYLDKYGAGLIVFLSKHSSSQDVSSFTTHAEGNWSEKAELGGIPHQLSVSSPISMLQLLGRMKDLKGSGPDVTYEATHHGPLLKTPSLFIELGGNEEARKNTEYLEVVSKSVVQFIKNETPGDFSKIVVGIGSNHYPSKFTALALDRGYAFAHIMPRYYTNECEMLDQAFTRSVPKPEAAVIDWKSIKAEERNKIINKLNDIGIDYERV